MCILKGFVPESGRSDREERPVRSLHSTELTLAYCAPSALDAALKPNRRQWTGNTPVVFGDRQVDFM